jgi:DNA gyrase/topoisomerase IV subunit A
MKEAETLIKQGKSKEEVSTLLMKKHNLTKEQADKIVIISKY